jgi:hypothetical protein
MPQVTSASIPAVLRLPPPGGSQDVIGQILDVALSDPGRFALGLVGGEGLQLLQGIVEGKTTSAKWRDAAAHEAVVFATFAALIDPAVGSIVGALNPAAVPVLAPIVAAVGIVHGLVAYLFGQLSSGRKVEAGPVVGAGLSVASLVGARGGSDLGLSKSESATLTAAVGEASKAAATVKPKEKAAAAKQSAGPGALALLVATVPFLR